MVFSMSTKMMQTLYTILGWLPFTIGGAIFFAVSLATLWWVGIQRVDLIFVIIGAVGSVISVIGMLCTLCAGIVVYMHMREIPYETSTMMVGVEQESAFLLQAPWWIPLIQTEWNYITKEFSVISNQTQDIVTKILPKRRGIYTNIQRNIVVGDAFGICRVSFGGQQETHIRVLPDTRKLHYLDILQGLQGGTEIANPYGKPMGDRIDMRMYAKGDPIRYVLWKIYARTGELLVRTPELALEPVKKMLVYLIVSPADTVSASVATMAIQSDMLGDNWTFSVDGSSDIYMDAPTAIDAIVQSGQSTEMHGVGLQAFVDKSKEVNTSIVIFAPPDTGLWIERVCQISLPKHIIICLDKIDIKNTWKQIEHAVFLPAEEPVNLLCDLAKIQQIHQAFLQHGYQPSISQQVTVKIPGGMSKEIGEFIRSIKDSSTDMVQS